MKGGEDGIEKRVNKKLFKQIKIEFSLDIFSLFKTAFKVRLER